MTVVGKRTDATDGVGEAAAPNPTAAPDAIDGVRETGTASSGRAVPLCIAALLLAAAVLIGFDVRGYKAGAAGEPGPAAVPILIAVLCTVAAIALVIQTMRTTSEGGAEAGAILPVRVLAAVAVLAAAAVLFELIGFFVTFAALTFVLGLLSGSRRWWMSLVVAVLVTWVVMITFGRLFGVPLPAAPIDVLLGG